jgi:hypothetical protein
MLMHVMTMTIHSFLAAAAAATPAGAGGAILKGAGEACGTSCSTGISLPTLLNRGAQILTYLIGSVSVLMIIYGGFRYVISRGDASNIKAAKETILYAVVGVVVAIVAYAIVQFVATTVGAK